MKRFSMKANSLVKLKALCLTLLGVASSTLLQAQYRITERYPIGGTGGYDYLRVDPEARRIYVSHDQKTEVLDADSGRKLAEITPGNIVRGIAFAPEFNHGFVSNAGDATILMFDLKTGKSLATIKSGGTRPDALDYDPGTKRLYVCNHVSGSLTVINAKDGAVVATIELGGTLEELAFDGRGRAFVNAEDLSLIHVVDLATLKKLASWPLAPGDGPTGLAIDAENHRLFAACGNNKLVVVNSDTGAIVADLPIGLDADGAAFDPKVRRIFAPTKDGKLTIIQEETADKYSVLQSLATQYGARTIALDRKTGRVFLPTGKFEPAPPTTPGGPAKERLTSGSFELLVVGPK